MKEVIKSRTRRVGLEVIQLVDELPQKTAAWILAKQVVRSATSIGANYRAACRAKSGADFINKLKTVEEEADETIYWLEIIRDAKLASANRVSALVSEVSEIVAITVASIKTARARSLTSSPNITQS